MVVGEMLFSVIGSCKAALSVWGLCAGGVGAISSIGRKGDG